MLAENEHDSFSFVFVFFLSFSYLLIITRTTTLIISFLFSLPLLSSSSSSPELSWAKGKNRKLLRRRRRLLDPLSISIQSNQSCCSLLIWWRNEIVLIRFASIDNWRESFSIPSPRWERWNSKARRGRESGQRERTESRRHLSVSFSMTFRSEDQRENIEGERGETICWII